MEETQSLIALSMVPNVGAVTAKTLIAYCGSAADVFRQNKRSLTKIPGVGEATAKAVLAGQEFLHKSEAEMAFMEKHGIALVSYTDKLYPQRLRNEEDSPLLFFYKGPVNFNSPKMLSIVGTRRATDYGKTMTERIVADLAPMQPVIVSGMAYGIDAAAHQAALRHDVPTIAVVAHGFSHVYPAGHKSLFNQLKEKGGILTEYPSYVHPDKDRFPARNRIIAALSDATLVVESDVKGGSIITANVAFSYSREVMAVPGRAGDATSAGCNFLIKSNKAQLVESGAEIAEQMGWKPEADAQAKVPKPRMVPERYKDIAATIAEHARIDIDTLSIKSGLNHTELAMTLLEMEMEGYVQALPGKFFRLVP